MHHMRSFVVQRWGPSGMERVLEALESADAAEVRALEDRLRPRRERLTADAARRRRVALSALGEAPSRAWSVATTGKTADARA